jgi:hypothetical protein
VRRIRRYNGAKNQVLHDDEFAGEIDMKNKAIEDVLSARIEETANQSESAYNELFNRGINPFQEIEKLDPLVRHFFTNNLAHTVTLGIRSDLRRKMKK